MNQLLLAGVIGLAVSSSVFANDENMTAHTAFKSNIAEMQSDYYRSLRVDEWIELGAKKSDILSAMGRLKASGESPLLDTENTNSPGHWTYEFVQTAQVLEEEAMKAQTADAYQRASTVYLVASYPNLHRANEIAALDKAVDLYLRAANLRGENVQKVALTRFDDRSIPGLLHLPKNTSKSVPAIIWTGGVDKTLIEHHAEFQELIDSGYAVLTLDMPGAGLDYKNHTELDELDASHQAAFEFLENNKNIDKDRIGVLSSSGSGITLMDFAIKQPKLKAVVARCALVDGPIGQKETLKFVPRMSADSFIARIGGDVGDMAYFEKHAPSYSMANRGLLDGKARMSTPLLVINAQKDPIASLEDMEKTAKLSSRGTVYVAEEFGHCPDSKAAQDTITQFLKQHI